MRQQPEIPETAMPVEVVLKPPLFLVFDQTTFSLKIGTCEHCVVQEQSRPARAWEAQGDKELDFERDKLLAGLATLGIEVRLKEQYICP
jgi:hypothetical protein